jgi:hypothetical protein
MTHLGLQKGILGKAIHRRDDDERGFLGFDEGEDAVEAVFDEEGVLGVLFITMSEIK